MSKIRDITFIAAMAVGAAFAPTALAHGDGHLIVFPDQLQWTDVPTLPPGAKMARIEGNPSEAKPFVARLKFPPGYRVPPHMHPAVERITVLTGTFNIGTGTDPKGATTALGPGGMVVLQPGTPHFVHMDKDRETIVQLNSAGPFGTTYVNPADDPRNR